MNHKLTLLLSTIICSLFLNGCAVSPKQYDTQQSRALNIARAGGIYNQDLQDSSDGTNSYKKSLLLRALNATALLTSLDAPLSGMTGAQTLAFNAGNIMATPDNPSARPSLMAWMPKTEATNKDDARIKFEELVDASLINTAQNMGIIVEKLADKGITMPKLNGWDINIWTVDAPQFGCKPEHCVIATHVARINDWQTPEFITSGPGASFILDSNHPSQYSRIIFQQTTEKVSFPVDEFYRQLSANLPAWSAMYFPPNTVFKDGQTLPYPVLYEHGQQLMFVTPQS